MIDARIVQRLAMATPGVVDESNDLSLRFSAGGKAFAWTWMERTAPRKPRRARMDVLAVRCALATKEMLLEALREFEGTMMFVSHDRTFLRGLGSRVLELGDEPLVYPGSYVEYVAQLGHEAPGIHA